MSFGEYILGDVVECFAVRSILTLAFFVLDHAALLVEFLLIHGT